MSSGLNRFARTEKQKNPSLQYQLLGQDKISCGATRLDACAPSQCIHYICRLWITDSHPVSHTKDLLFSVLRTDPNPFLFALRSPFRSPSPAAISAPAALCADRRKTYSLFLNGLVDFNTLTCQMSRINFQLPGNDPGIITLLIPEVSLRR